MEDITDADYMHTKRVCKDFEIKNLGEYHDLHLKSVTSLLADAFKNVRKMRLKSYYLDPVKFLSALGLAWQAAFKKTDAKLEILIDIDMLLVVEKGITRGICHAIHGHAKVNNKYMKKYDKNKNHHMLNIGMQRFIRLCNVAGFEKTLGNVTKYRNIKLVTTERRRNYLVSEPNYHTTEFFSENLLATEMRKTQILMNKSVYLGLLILDLSKTVMYEFWYDYVTPKCG